jgi:integrase
MPTSVSVLLPSPSLTSEAALRVMLNNSVVSKHSKRAYSKAFDDFLALAGRTGQPISRALLMEYRALMIDQGLSASTINVRLSGIRKLVKEARESGLIDPMVAERITTVSGVPGQGLRLGHWLSEEQTRQLLAVPDRTRLKGKRDFAILSVLANCALRREELAGLDLARIQLREGRCVIADLVGKRGRVRTVALPGTAKAAVDEWTTAAGITSGPLLRRLSKSGHILPGKRLSAWAVWDVVVTSARAIGIEDFGPHDARRYAESRIMPNRNLSPQDVGWPGIISRESIRHNRADHRLLKNPRSLSSGW